MQGFSLLLTNLLHYGSIVVVGFLLGWVALATSPANAQTSRDQVWTQLQSAYTVAAEDGYKQLNYIIGWLNNGSEPDLNWPLSLVAGSHYLLAGACDNDCTDFDLTIEDGDRAVLASDTEVDDIPMVSFTPSAFLEIPYREFSLRWYSALVSNEEFLSAMRNSALFAAASSVLSVIVAVPAAIAIGRQRFPGSAGIRSFLLSPMMVPSVVLGIAFLKYLSTIGLASTVVGLVICHCIVVTP